MYDAMPWMLIQPGHSYPYTEKIRILVMVIKIFRNC